MKYFSADDTPYDPNAVQQPFVTEKWMVFMAQSTHPSVQRIIKRTLLRGTAHDEKNRRITQQLWDFWGVTSFVTRVGDRLHIV